MRVEIYVFSTNYINLLKSFYKFKGYTYQIYKNFLVYQYYNYYICHSSLIPYLRKIYFQIFRNSAKINSENLKISTTFSFFYSDMYTITMNIFKIYTKKFYTLKWQK